MASEVTRLACATDALMGFLLPAAHSATCTQPIPPSLLDDTTFRLHLAIPLAARPSSHHGELLRPQSQKGRRRRQWQLRTKTRKGPQQGPALGREIVCTPETRPSLSTTRSRLTLCSRPKSLSDVTAQDHTVTVLQRTMQASNVRVVYPDCNSSHH